MRFKHEKFLSTDTLVDGIVKLVIIQTLQTLLVFSHIVEYFGYEIAHQSK